ncbi:MAG TPA: fatty acid desaturase [Allosphingosinicella sp.]|jgi:fatty acid desaturase
MDPPRHYRKTLLLLVETVGLFALLVLLAGVSSKSLPQRLAWPAVALLSIGEGLWFDRMYTVAHEAVHRKLFPLSKLNDFVGAALMLPLIAPFTIYRKIHGFHHGANRRDPQTAALDHFRVSASAPAWERTRYKAVWLFYVFCGGFFLQTLAIILIFLVVPTNHAEKISPVFRSWPRRLRIRAWVEFGLGVAIHVGAAAAFGGAMYLAVLGLPMVVFAWVWSLLLYVYHYRTSVGPEVLHNVRSLPRQPLFSWLLLNFNEHATHHRDPNIPWYELPTRRYRLPASHSGNDDVHSLAAAIWQQRLGPVLWSDE